MPFRLWQQRAFYLLLLAGAVVSFAAMAFAVAARFDEAAAACHQVNALRIVITLQIERSEQTLPKLSYYRQHPGELALAQRQGRQGLSLFHPVRC